MIYAGIGARATPGDILGLMTAAACYLDLKGYRLRSGGAKGADTAFELGSTNKEIFRPEDATEAALELASMIHPAWDRCAEWTKKAHARNCMILLGKELDHEVDFVLCYTADGKASGGTGQALRLAEREGIKIFNMYYPEIQGRVQNMISK